METKVVFHLEDFRKSIFCGLESTLVENNVFVIFRDLGCDVLAHDGCLQIATLRSQVSGSMSLVIYGDLQHERISQLLYRTKDKWKAPPSDIIKINTDAAVDLNNSCFGLGIIVRNEEGLVLLSSSLFLQAGFLPEIAEATAILRGIQLALDAGLHPFVVESDNLNVVNLILAKEPPRSEIGLVISDILNLLVSVDFISISYVPRTVNSVTHDLAKFTLSIFDDRIWIEEVSNCIEPLIRADNSSIK
ncbi:hypothetical protein ACOSQ2_023870 [Xanthoceras sorbifolium]